jgi:arylsulfatase A-like enzyme
MRLLLAILVVATFDAAASFDSGVTASAQDKQEKPSRPNFVIMRCDDQRWDAMSIAGNTVLKTLNMDRIGREGIVFRNAFITNSLCGPSRASILTGAYSHTNGMIDNRPKTDIRPEAPWMPDLLRAAGYEVAFCGKSHQKNALRERKWDYYFGYCGIRS